MRITNSGTYEPCRWMVNNGISRVDFNHSIYSMSPLTYFQTHMAPLRQQLLQGQQPDLCQNCYIMEQHSKPSGRQRQSIKVGILGDHFAKSLASSPMRPDFDHSHCNQGQTQRTVTDWQIDLGNYCNGACVYCNPENSSTLATEFKKLGFIDQLPPSSWCDDDQLLDKFIQDLTASSNLQYLHFLGGETLITPGFKKILSALVNHNLASRVTIGFTTNLTVWSDAVIELLTQFYSVNLGMSIETLTPLNDYVRYPSQQSQTVKLLNQWIQLGKQQNWLMQLRTTPTCLTVHELDTVYDFAWHNQVSVESCNFLSDPEFLKISVLPIDQRRSVIQRLKQWIQDHAVVDQEQIINTRDPNVVHAQIVQDAKSYLNYLELAADESHRLPDLMIYLKRLENHRGNKITQYLPEYEDLFRSAGY